MRAGMKSVRFYCESRLDLVVTNEGVCKFLRANEKPLAEAQAGKLSLFGLDELSSVIVCDGKRAPSYAAYGYFPSDRLGSGMLSFTGEPRDATGDFYHLGNGKRAYSPSLRRFMSPDKLSPFLSGGLNTYAYCGGDPVNYSDPTGLTRWWQKLGIGRRRSTVGSLDASDKLYRQGYGEGFDAGRVKGNKEGYGEGVVKNLEIQNELAWNRGFEAGQRLAHESIQLQGSASRPVSLPSSPMANFVSKFNELTASPYFPDVNLNVQFPRGTQVLHILKEQLDSYHGLPSRYPGADIFRVNKWVMHAKEEMARLRDYP